MKLSKHFSFEELTTTSKANLLKKNKEKAQENITSILSLAFFAEQIREFIEVPMVVTSGYRCAELNKAIGGVSGSQHVFFQALDFIPKGITIDECFDKIRNSKLVYGQLIKEKSGKSVWIHVGMGDKRENLIYKDGKYKSV